MNQKENQIDEQENAMNQKEEIFDVDPIIKVFHVGGRGGFGPTDALLPIGSDLSVTLFEADIDNPADYDSVPIYYKKTHGISASVVQQCLSNTIGKKEFNINVMSASSSLLKIDKDKENWTHPISIKWGQICKHASSIIVDVTTMDELYINKKIQKPDFLSLDAQGAEYDILECSSIALRDSLVGIITEVEFSPIYEGQKLFTDQDVLLRRYQFNLVELYNIERWYPGPITGMGHVMVAEALFLRDYRYFINKYKTSNTLLLSSIAKLAIVADCFLRRSYATNIMEYIANNFKQEWENYVKSNNNIYLNNLTKAYVHTNDR